LLFVNKKLLKVTRSVSLAVLDSLTFGGWPTLSIEIGAHHPNLAGDANARASELRFGQDVFHLEVVAVGDASGADARRRWGTQVRGGLTVGGGYFERVRRSISIVTVRLHQVGEDAS
jgi:hypothetical protein